MDIIGSGVKISVALVIININNLISPARDTIGIKDIDPKGRIGGFYRAIIYRLTLLNIIYNLRSKTSHIDSILQLLYKSSFPLSFVP